MAARLLIDQGHDVVLHGRNEGRSRDALAAAAGGLNPVQFKSRADAERWYIQNVTDHMKPNVPHAVIGDNGGFELLLGPAAYGLLDVACRSAASRLAFSLASYRGKPHQFRVLPL
jgi:hypothetical protein